MPTPLTDLGIPEVNFLHAFWKAVRDDLHHNSPIFGFVPNRFRRLEKGRRATIEKEIAYNDAIAFLESPAFDHFVSITSQYTNTEISPASMREALYAHS